MSLEQAIENNTKALQSIATSLAVILAKGSMPTIQAKAEAEVQEEKPVVEKPKRATKKAEEKPVAEKTNKDLMQEVLNEEAPASEPTKEPEQETMDDLLGSDSDELPEPAVTYPELAEGERNTTWISKNIVPYASQLKREDALALLGKHGVEKMSALNHDQLTEFFHDVVDHLRLAGKNI